MAQKITLSIAGRRYQLEVNSPEEESIMRKAAEQINQQVSLYDRKYSTVQTLDKLAFIALSNTVAMLKYRDEKTTLQNAVDALSGELDSYLKGIDR